MISSVWMRPQGPYHPLNKLLEVCCAKIMLKIEENSKSHQKRGIFNDFFEFWCFFWSFFNFGSILAQELIRFISKKIAIFWHSWDPWGRVHSDLNKQIVSKLAVWHICHLFLNTTLELLEELNWALIYFTFQLCKLQIFPPQK